MFFFKKNNSMGEDRFLIYTKYYTNHPHAIEFLQTRQEDAEFFKLLLECQVKKKKKR